MPKDWEDCSIEEHYFGDDRKLNKSNRKKAISKDRSKYKKTDQVKIKAKQKLSDKKFQETTLPENLIKGLVLSINPKGYIVSSNLTNTPINKSDLQSDEYVCHLRGSLKKDKTQHKNLVTVGDFVYFEKTGHLEGAIVRIEPRRSVLSRADNLSRRKEQLIAANIDQVLITTSVVLPPLKPSLVDRYIIAADKGGMKPIIVVNKIDLLTSTIDKSEQEDHTKDQQFSIDQEKEIYHEFIKAYQTMGIPVIPVSTVSQTGLKELQGIMKDNSSVFSGQSGVGKSSLISTITGLDLRVGKMVDKTKKGSHTTTTAQLIPLPFGGWCIDTPGIKSFGLWDLEYDEIVLYFSDIFEIGKNCKFPNCTHTHEQNCAVIKAVEQNALSFLRYQSYLQLLASLQKEHLRR